MDGLQRAIEEPASGRLQRISPPSSVGSMGILGVAGLTTSAAGGSASWGLWLPPMSQELERRSRQTPLVVVGYRSRELEWRRTHAEALKAFEDQWVVLEGEEIVAHGRDPVRLVAEARARGIQTPYVFYVEPTDEDVAMIGL